MQLTVKSDSRRVKPGDTFVALPGVTSDGHDFIPGAIKNGAVKIIAQHGEYPVDYEIVPDSRAWLERRLDELYGSALRAMTLVGVTGTNGKTTTAYELYDALRRSGRRCAYIGTNGFFDNSGYVRELINTTPDICELYELLLDANNGGCDFAVVEASSQGLDMGRFGLLDFSSAVFTNLSHDHLDYHGNMERYAAAKALLFQKLRPGGFAMINADDFYARRFMLSGNRNLTYGFRAGDWRVGNFTMDTRGSDFDVTHDGVTTHYHSRFLGEYSVYNVMPTIIFLHELGVDGSASADIVGALNYPEGRLEVLHFGERTVVIDFAHTPESFVQLFTTVNRVRKGRAIVVQGGCGSRDREKRSMMAKLACEMTDYSVCTLDNVYYEDPQQILDDFVRDGRPDNLELIMDRRAAIRRGLELTGPGDMLLILGRGHEQHINVGGKKYVPFSDKQVACELAAELGYGAPEQ